jgi:hypothetical protein
MRRKELKRELIRPGTLSEHETVAGDTCQEAEEVEM